MRNYDVPEMISQARTVPANALSFFRGFLRCPTQVGSIIPSSRFLEHRLVSVGRVCEARTVVEFGPGTGGTTRALLRALPQNGTLLAVEIDPQFAEMLRAEIGDERLIAHEGSASQIENALAGYKLAAPEAVISGIPFSTMSEEVGINILRAVRSVLAPAGRFVAYQVSSRVAVLGREIFGQARMEVELLNVPPLRVYTWQKPG
jgi:phosphatidylethanolamine/phosphatidyl-N-methylethanolamine N-methyltransferase